MKSSILIMAVTVCMVGTMITGCKTSSEKVENAQDKVIEAKNDMLEAQGDLNKTLQDSITDYQKFKIESEAKISAYEKSMAEFKTRIANEKKENKASYEKKLAELEQKSSEMKKKLEEYKDEGQDKWTSFKNEFNHDMDELGQALKDLTVDNKK